MRLCHFEMSQDDVHFELKEKHERHTRCTAKNGYLFYVYHTICWLQNWGLHSQLSHCFNVVNIRYLASYTSHRLRSGKNLFRDGKQTIQLEHEKYNE